MYSPSLAFESPTILTISALVCIEEEAEIHSSKEHFKPNSCDNRVRQLSRMASAMRYLHLLPLLFNINNPSCLSKAVMRRDSFDEAISSPLPTSLISVGHHPILTFPYYQVFHIIKCFISSDISTHKRFYNLLIN